MPEEWLLFHQNQLMGKVWVDGEGWVFGLGKGWVGGLGKGGWVGWEADPLQHHYYNLKLIKLIQKYKH